MEIPTNTVVNICKFIRFADIYGLPLPLLIGLWLNAHKDTQELRYSDTQMCDGHIPNSVSFARPFFSF